MIAVEWHDGPLWEGLGMVGRGWRRTRTLTGQLGIRCTGFLPSLLCWVAHVHQFMDRAA